MPIYRVGFQGPGGYTPHIPVEAGSFEEAIQRANGPALENTVALILGPDNLGEFIHRGGQWRAHLPPNLNIAQPP